MEGNDLKSILLNIANILPTANNKADNANTLNKVFADTSPASPSACIAVVIANITVVIEVITV